jgi:hypothetical protein
MSAPLAHRLGALLCGALYFPLGLAWAYGLALLFLPVVGLGFWLLRRADRFEAAEGLAPSVGELRLRAAARGLLWTGLAASAVALVLTR